MLVAELHANLAGELAKRHLNADKRLLPVFNNRAEDAQLAQPLAGPCLCQGGSCPHLLADANGPANLQFQRRNLLAKRLRTFAC
jgi:hypothetical protein